MADVSKLIADLIQAGLDPMLVGRVAATIAEVSAPAQDAVDLAAERRRAWDRERKQKKTEKRNSTGIPPEPSEANSTGVSTGIPPETAPLTRVKDNKLTTSLSGDHTSLQNAGVTRESLDELERKLRAEGSPALNQAAPKLIIVAPILALLNGQTGPPCDLEADVLPVIRSKSKSARPGSISSWEFYRPAILEARDRRLQSNPEVIPLDEHRPRTHSAPSDKLQRTRDNFSRAFSGADRAPDRSAV